MIPFVLWLMSSSGDNYRRCSWNVSPLLLSFTEAAEQDVCPHVLLQFPSSWVTLTHQWAVLGQRLCLSQLLSLQALPCIPFTRREAVFPPGRSYRGIRFPSVQWQRALPKLPKKSGIRLDWKERNKIQSVMDPTELCCFSGAGRTARMELGWWLGWQGRVHPSGEGSLCDENRNNSQARSTKAMDILKCQKRERCTCAFPL